MREAALSFELRAIFFCLKKGVVTHIHPLDGAAVVRGFPSSFFLRFPTPSEGIHGCSLSPCVLRKCLPFHEKCGIIKKSWTSSQSAFSLALRVRGEGFLNCEFLVISEVLFFVRVCRAINRTVFSRSHALRGNADKTLNVPRLRPQKGEFHSSCQRNKGGAFTIDY